MKNYEHDQIQESIDVYLHTGDNTKLKKVLHIMIKCWDDYSEIEDDYRGGEETYGYNAVMSQLKYISDRWECAFRIKWIIDGIENGKI